MKSILKGYNPIGVERRTKDDWVDGRPSMEKIQKILNDAVKKIDDRMTVEIHRNYTATRSAGFEIFNGEGEKVTSIDLSIRENPYQTLYKQPEISFYGASVDKILADKISAISSPRIMRRAKDILDVYALSYSTSCNCKKIKDIMSVTQRPLYDFSAFKLRKEELEYAYNTLSEISNKPAFDNVYKQVSKFLEPFMKETMRDCIWNNNAGIWKDSAELNIQLKRQNQVRRDKGHDLEP